MTGAYDARQRRELEQALEQEEPALCPVCRVAVSAQPVDQPAAVSYVRHRVWVICPQCRRTASLDVRPARG